MARLTDSFRCSGWRLTPTTISGSQTGPITRSISSPARASYSPELRASRVAESAIQSNLPLHLPVTFGSQTVRLPLTPSASSPVLVRLSRRRPDSLDPASSAASLLLITKTTFGRLPRDRAPRSQRSLQTVSFSPDQVTRPLVLGGHRRAVSRLRSTAMGTYGCHSCI